MRPTSKAIFRSIWNCGSCNGVSWQILFQVVPSQINYVIKTRFTESRGYLVESKRGGGGYIRIGRIEFSSHHEMLRGATLLNWRAGQSRNL